MHSSLFINALLLSISLVEIIARPIQVNSNLSKRTGSIADEAGEIGQVLVYLDCEISSESELAAAALGLSTNQQSCGPPPSGLKSSTSSPSVQIPSTQSPQAQELTPSTATTSSKSIPLGIAQPVIVQPIVPIVQPFAVIPRPQAAAPEVVTAPAPAVVINPLQAPTPISPSSSESVAQQNACTSTDPDVCYEQKLALDAHNVARRAHHAPDLVWNDDLAKAALRWAEHCTWGHSGGQLFPDSFVYGENIFASTATEPTTSMATAITAYTNEETLYDYNNPVFSEATGHFTQVVWVNTKEVGCAIINCDLDAFQKYGDTTASYSVCVYSPSGNYKGEFTANVLPR